MPTDRPDKPHEQRRVIGGGRHESSDRVVLRRRPVSTHPGGDETTGPTLPLEVDGWALNVSRGGARVVVEGEVREGALYEARVGDHPPRLVRIAWSRQEAGGQIVGFEFLEAEEPGVPPPPDDPEAG